MPGLRRWEIVLVHLFLHMLCIYDWKYRALVPFLPFHIFVTLSLLSDFSEYYSCLSSACALISARIYNQNGIANFFVINISIYFIRPRSYGGYAFLLIFPRNDFRSVLTTVYLKPKNVPPISDIFMVRIFVFILRTTTIILFVDRDFNIVPYFDCASFFGDWFIWFWFAVETSQASCGDFSFRIWWIVFFFSTATHLYVISFDVLWFIFT